MQLPSWEWNSLIEEIERIKAKDYMQIFYATSLGFNGGESAEAYMKQLSKTVHKGFEEEIKVTKLADVMPGIDELIPIRK